MPTLPLLKRHDPPINGRSPLLIAALPAHPDDKQERLTITGEIPSALAPPSGCRFHTRCPHAMPRCTEEIPLRKEVSPNHSVACHLYTVPPSFPLPPSH